MNLREYAEIPERELIERINKGKIEKNILILAHNYARPEVQRVADHVGDSLELSRIARDTDKSTILFAGVLFMAETAKILSPEKTILLPDPTATCPMAAEAAFQDVLQCRKENPDAKFVTYVNSTAEVKSLSDLCCTSSNSVQVVESIPDDKIVFMPDKNLGRYTENMTGRDLILWDGMCYVHAMIDHTLIDSARELYPDAVIIVHPECPEKVTDKADLVGSTGFMYKYAKENPDKKIILGTEVGMVERIREEFPDIWIKPLKPNAVCSNMKLNTLPKMLRSIEEGVFEVKLDQDIIEGAQAALEAMVAIG